MKNILIAAFVVLNVAFSNAQNPNFEWVKSIGSVDDEYTSKIVTDNIGNSYCLGRSNGSVGADLDPSVSTYTLSSPYPYGNFFLAKLDPLGNFLWGKGTEDPLALGGASGNSMCLDNLGNIYITGEYFGMVDFDFGPATSILNSGSISISNPFILKMDALGNFVWVKHLDSFNNAYCSQINVDNFGNIFTVGYANDGTMDFDPSLSTYTVTGGMSSVGFSFVLKLDVNGDFVWVKTFGDITGGTFNNVTSLQNDASGNIYASVMCNGNVDFDPGVGTYTLSPLVIGGNINAVFKLDGFGNFVWAKNIRGKINSSTVDAVGNVYITSFVQFFDFMTSTDIDPGVGVHPVTLFGSQDFVVLKLNSLGDFLWGNIYGGSDGDYSNAIKVDGSGGLYVCGSSASNVVDFGGGVTTHTVAGTLANSGTYITEDAFVLKLDTAGVFLWVKSFNGPGEERISSVDVNTLGDIYTLGEYFTQPPNSGPADYDPGIGVSNLTSAGGYDIFIHKMSQCFAISAPVNATSTANQIMCSGNTTTLSASSTNTINWYATPTSSVILGSGSSFITPSLTVGSYTFYAEAASTCTISNLRTPVTVTVNPLPILTVTSSNTLVCVGQTATITASGASTYTWNTGSTNPNVIVTPTVTANYNYTIMGTNAIGCQNTTVFTQSVSACTGINNLTTIGNDLFMVYPNPSKEKINIAIESANDYHTQIQILNALGQVVISEPAINSISTISISSLSSGIYFVKVIQQGRQQVLKLVKE